jgi:glycosyltransferase involved in cell wall biosynthesis
MNIEWLLSGTAPKWVEEDYRDGGAVYETYVRKVLSCQHHISVRYMPRGNHPSKMIRVLQFIRYAYKNVRLRYQGEIVIRDLFSTVFAPFDRRRKNVVIIHHLDFSSAEYPTLYKWIMRRFFKRIRLADTVIVVSQHWKKILEKVGCPDVQVIYNSFDLEMFNFDRQQLREFQKKGGINQGKPIIYLGNARAEKGYREVFEKIRDLDAVFVVTGKHKTFSPIRQFYLDYQDYLRLLKSCSLVLTMSGFNEGWCRTAHEAMLCGTPVIGSGRGGMKELLEKGGQIICKNLSQLQTLVIRLLNDRKKLDELGDSGRDFAMNFSLDYFKKSWTSLIETVASGPQKLRILHLTHNIEPYGINTFLFHLTQAQRRYRDLNIVMAVNADYKNIYKFRKEGIFVHSLPRCSARNPRLFVFYLRLFREYDIINLHTYSPWAILAAVLLKKKVIYIFHGAFGFKSRWADIIKRQFYRLIVNHLSDRIVFASEASLSIYQGRIGKKLTPKKIAVFPFGLQIERIKAKKSREEMRLALGKDGKYLIGTVARIDPVKRIERLIETFITLPGKDDFHLLIVGAGEEDYQKRLIAQIEREGLEDSVSFLGYREDVFDIVNALDFFVLPSTMETFGLALLEAMALGIPSSIFQDAGGSIDILGDTGTVVRSPEQLKDIILKVKNDHVLREQLSVLLKQRAQRFDIKNASEKFYSLYQQLD